MNSDRVQVGKALAKELGYYFFDRLVFHLNFSRLLAKLYVPDDLASIKLVTIFSINFTLTSFCVLLCSNDLVQQAAGAVELSEDEEGYREAEVHLTVLSL